MSQSITFDFLMGFSTQDWSASYIFTLSNPRTWSVCLACCITSKEGCLDRVKSQIVSGKSQKTGSFREMPGIPGKAVEITFGIAHHVGITHVLY